MQQHSTNLEASQTIRMHEALTPELLRHIYSEGQLPVIHPLVGLYAWVKRSFLTIFKVR